MHPDDEALREKIREEVQREMEINNRYSFGEELSTLAGGLAGSGAGFLSIEPARVIGENIEYNNDIRMSQMKEKEKQVLQSLREIFLGRASFEDFGANQKILRKLYEEPEMRSIFENEKEFKSAMDFLSRGNIVGFPHANPNFLQKMQRVVQQLRKTPLLPVDEKGVLRNSITHPLVAAGALGGGALVNQIYNYYDKK